MPRGAASWGFGGVIPTKAGIVIDLSPFRNILALDTAQKTVTVEGGRPVERHRYRGEERGPVFADLPIEQVLDGGRLGLDRWLRHQQLQIRPPGEADRVHDGRHRPRGNQAAQPADREFAYFVSGEGEFGIIVEVTLKLREVPRASYPHLLYFPGDREAFAFVEKSRATQGPPGTQPQYHPVSG